MSILRKTQILDSNMQDVEVRNSFVQMEIKLKKTLTKLKQGELPSQEEIFLIKRHIQEIKELLTRNNI